MVARRLLGKKRRGQSMLEFALLLPVIVLMLQILMEAESAISTAIVNQKYARSTMHWLFFNHRNYMELSRFHLDAGILKRRFWVGVDDKVSYGQPDADIKPVAPIRKIGRLKSSQDETAGAEFEEITERKDVRVRSTTFTCLPPTAVKGIQLLTEKGMEEDTFSGNYHYCSD